MKYPRPPYLSPEIPTERTRVLCIKMTVDVPKIDYPISAVENFRRAAARNNPLWVPNDQLDFQTMFSQALAVGRQQGPDYDHTDEDYEFTDLFNVPWTWVASAGGPMLTPGTQLLDDITNWEEELVWPDLKGEWEWNSIAEDFMKNKYDPNKVLHINFGQGCTERLVAILGGYTESMMALAIEPEAVKDFFDRFVEFEFELIDLLCSLYPVDMMTYHDDWGTERDTFFSEKMMEELVYEPTKRIVDHVKSKGIVFQLHSCGNITRFLPYIVDMGIDFVQAQRRAVDLPAAKEKWGDKLGFNSYSIEGIVPGEHLPKEEYLQRIRNTVDMYAKGGGFYTMVSPDPDPTYTWDGTFELYCYSREFYDKERGE